MVIPRDKVPLMCIAPGRLNYMAIQLHSGFRTLLVVPMDRVSSRLRMRGIMKKNSSSFKYIAVYKFQTYRVTFL